MPWLSKKTQKWKCSPDVFFYTPARKNEHVYIHARMLEHFEHFEIIEKNESFSKKIIETHRKKPKIFEIIEKITEKTQFPKFNSFDSIQFNSI